MDPSGLQTRDMSAIRSLLAPNTIAVVGASEDESKFGGRLFSNVLRFGFAGRIYPINPTRPKISGITAYPAIRDVPERIDVAAQSADIVRKPSCGGQSMTTTS